jgi:hypothetical protein
VFPRIQPSRHLGCELNTVTRPVEVDVRIAFPDLYIRPVASASSCIILNKNPRAERAYPAVDSALLRPAPATVQPGGKSSLRDLMHRHLQYELSYSNILHMLLSDIPVPRRSASTCR